METLEQKLSGLSPDQRRLVELWLRREQAADVPPASGAIPRRRIIDPGALSFAQQRLWLLCQLDPDSPAYNLRTIVRLTGPLDAGALERSLNEIVRRHETLRTTFVIQDGQPRQVVAPTLHLPLPLVDRGDVPPDEQDARIHELALTETEQPFDLERGPLFRVRLLRLRPEEHVLLLTMHHIISDGWSQGVQLRELMALYAAFAQGKPSPLPELPIQYADYALWQRQWLQSSKQEQQVAYWKAQLGYADRVLELPTDRPRPPMATYHGAWDYFTLPASLLEGLAAVSRHEGVTLFMTLLAAFDVLLYRYTGQTDLVVGTPIAGRNRSELEGLIGCFLNMLALRTDLSGNPTFRELLQRVRKVTLGAYSHQDIPIEKLIEELRLARDLSRNPIFQVMLVLQNMPMPELNSAGLVLKPMEVTSTTSLLDLSLYFRELKHELLIRVEYNTDLFNTSTIERMLTHFQVLLEEVVADPARRISELPLLAAEQRSQLPPVEEMLAELWANILGLERVAARDSFFDLGGDQSKAVQLITRIRETFKVDLSIRNLFEAPSVAAMAELLVAREARPGQTEKIAQMLKRIRGMPAADRQKALDQKRRVRGPA
jgi:acyl carrier protein